MLDFWDRAWLVRSSLIHEYYEQKRKEESRWEEYCSKTVQEILSDCTIMTKKLDDLLKPQTGIHLHPDLKTGIICLPLYGFYLVMGDGKKLTQDQDYIVQSIFSSFRRDIPFSYSEYMDAINSDNKARQELLDIVGVSEDKAGKFWIQFFKTVYRTDADESVLSDFLHPFDDLTMKFSALSGQPESALVPILQLFYLRLRLQIENCRSLPDDKIDLYGDKTYKEHYQIYKQEMMDVLNLTMDEDDEDLNPRGFFKHFTAGIIYQLISRSTFNKEKKIEITQETFDDLEIISFYTANLYEYPNIPDGQMTMFELNAHLYTDPRQPLGWEMLLRGASTFAEKKGDKDKVDKVSHAVVNFLTSLENHLVDKYKFTGLGSVAQIYTAYVLSLVVNEKVSMPFIDENNKILYTEPPLSADVMKQRNGVGLNTSIYSNETNAKQADYANKVDVKDSSSNTNNSFWLYFLSVIAIIGIVILLFT
ncbi:hypothetical protein SAMN04487830_102113 [Pseudobutyrivibrio sp. OR37]|uniref:hypothetical protein n=1 Tax=Pseudobutyrivibrio sp. OR37 TaxID=1798186 RepID=UPI0008E5EDBD|nr:hypothetical protein [Pseudobutyrivibrio sp. OR37]SFH57852.1 hypothetical protein SAMN04487830_102113 [Pseudobutyrivibrio sp. OR37]